MNQPSPKPRPSLSPAAPVDAVTLDCERALTHAGGDVGLLMQLCIGFLGELPLRMEELARFLAARDYRASEHSLQMLRNCLMVFGSGHVSFTAEILETAVHHRRQRQAQREWRRLESQVSVLVPQVQRLMLEMAQPTTAVQ